QVTGASGYVGFEIVHQLLEAGYLVRGSARGSKFEGLKNALARFPNFEAVEIQDVSTADFSDAFKGVQAVIHTAAPVPTRLDKTNTTMKVHVSYGYLNVVRQAHKAGVKKLVVTSSITSYPIDWNSVTEEQAASGNPWFLYGAQKKFGDQAVIEYAKSHPEIDVTICMWSITFPLSTPIRGLPRLTLIHFSKFIFQLRFRSFSLSLSLLT
ncbi:NAD(P)-binding protein, partial [Dendrothele bispora CBS 962.96]